MENEEVLPGPVILDVEPISCSMTITRARDQESSLPNSLVMHLRIADGDEVRLPGGRNLNEAEWWMTFYEEGSGNKFTDLHNAIGMINYYEEWHSDHYDVDDTPEACHAWANLDAKTFSLLSEIALVGKLPSGLRLHCRGMNYGWEPDGSAKVWDVEAHKNAIIDKIEISASFVKTPVPARPAAGADVFSVAPPTPETPELVAIRAATKAIEQGNARLGWMVALLAVTLAVVFFR